MLTQVDLAAVIALHRERKAKATIVLTPVDNPSAYGLVETDERGNIQRFLEKPNADEITCDTINAGIYVLEPDTFDRIPEGHAVVDRAQLLPVADRARRDVRRLRLSRLLDRHRHAGEVHAGAPRHHGRPLRRPPRSKARRSPPRRRTAWVSPEARIEEGAIVEGPCFIDEGVVVKAGARIGPYSVIGRQCHIEEHAVARTARSSGRTRRISQEAIVRRSILGRHCHIGRSAMVDDGVVLGDKSVVTDYSRL